MCDARPAAEATATAEAGQVGNVDRVAGGKTARERQQVSPRDADSVKEHNRRRVGTFGRSLGDAIATDGAPPCRETVWRSAIQDAVEHEVPRTRRLLPDTIRGVYLVGRPSKIE